MTNRERIIAEDYVDHSKALEYLEKLKDSSTRVIEFVIKELEIELSERDTNYVKSMENKL